MNYIDNLPEPEATHPVLAKLYERIAELEEDKTKALASAEIERTKSWQVASEFANYRYKLENVLRTIGEDDESTIPAMLLVASEFDITLSTTKSYRVVAEFDVSIEVPFGDIDFEPDGSDFWADLDYTGDGDFTLDGQSITSIDEN